MVSCRLTANVVAACLLVATPGLAQTWKPEKAIEIIVGTSPGGPQDRTARLVQKGLQDLKLAPVPVNVVNRPGGGGAVGLTYLSKHTGDGQLLMLNAISLLTNHITGKSPLSHTDFTPIAIMGVEYVGVTVRAESPIRSGKDLVERLRKDPSSVSVAIGTALGNATHISFVLAMKAAGVDIRRLRTVVFSSGGESMTALLGGHVDVAASAPSSVLAQVEAGKLRMVAVGAPKRLGGALADVPTWKELGVNNTFDLWRGLAGPKGMSRAQVAWWDSVLAQVAQSEEWKREMAQNLVENVYKNSAETEKHWKAEYDEVRAVLTELGLAKQ